MSFRPKFVEALSLFATAIERLTAKGHPAPVLVGGAAVELYTAGQVTSGDFDFVSPEQAAFFEELKALGFELPNETGWLQHSLLHPELLFGVQVVSQPLMDGRADDTRIRVIDVEATNGGKGGKLRVIPLEDLIADRMAQALDGSKIRKDMQNQAVRMYQLADDLDKAYLDARIRTETGDDASLETLTSWALEFRS